MKKRNMLLVAATMAATAVMTGCGESGSDRPFEPKDDINRAVTSSPGGGSDIYTRMIPDVMVKDSLASGQTIIVVNKAGGSDEARRNKVVGTKGKRVDYTLLTFNNDDLMPMVQNIRNRSSSFRILAVIAVDKQLTFEGGQTQHVGFNETVEAAKNGAKVVIGGSKGDDIATYDALIAKLGIGKDMMTYITYDPTGGAVTTALGDHIEFIISKPMAATEYVTTGSLIPVLTSPMERYAGNLADTPTLNEIGGHESVEMPVWRGAAAPAVISDSVAAFWSERLKKVSETDAWNTDYLEKNKLIGNYMDMTAATEYMTNYGKNYVESMGIQ